MKSSSERVNNVFEPTSQFGIYLSKICGIPNKRVFFWKEQKKAEIKRFVVVKWANVELSSWWGKGLPSWWFVAGLGERTATSELE
jgi:hypothetical protein